MTITRLLAYSIARLILVAPLTLPAQSPAKWRLVEAWRKGGAVDGAYAFDKINDRIGAVAGLPGGKIVVLDPEAPRLHMLDTNGTVIRSFGGRGSGPGEMRNGRGLAIAPDGRILVNDPSNGRFVVFKPNGDFDRSASARLVPAFSWDMFWDGSFDRAGRLLLSVPLRAKLPRTPPGAPAGLPVTSMLFDSTLVTSRWSADLSRADSLSMCGAPPPISFNTTQHFMFVTPGSGVVNENAPPGGRPPGGGVGWLPIPFAEQRWAFVRDREGNEWSPSAIGSGELLKRENGKCATVIARVALRGPRTPIPAARRDSAVKKAKPEMRSVIPREYPWFHSLRVDDENRLWVERDVPSGKRFEVFASDGTPVADIDAPRELLIDYPIAVAHGRLYGFVKTADDIPYLVSWRIVRS